MALLFVPIGTLPHIVSGSGQSMLSLGPWVPDFPPKPSPESLSPWAWGLQMGDGGILPFSTLPYLRTLPIHCCSTHLTG